VKGTLLATGALGLGGAHTLSSAGSLAAGRSGVNHFEGEDVLEEMKWDCRVVDDLQLSNLIAGDEGLMIRELF
jgi:hypothetical protein